MKNEEQEKQFLIQKLKELRRQIKEDTLTRREVLNAQNMLTKMATEEGKPCERCGRVLPLTIDHIVPQYLLLQMGIDIKRLLDEDNIQLLCRPCNQYKDARLDMADKRTIPLLKKYISLAESL